MAARGVAAVPRVAAVVAGGGGGFGVDVRVESRAWRADSASTLRIASSSASRSRVISDSSSAGTTPRNCATSAVRARS